MTRDFWKQGPRARQPVFRLRIAVKQREPACLVLRAGVPVQ